MMSQSGFIIRGQRGDSCVGALWPATLSCLRRQVKGLHRHRQTLARIATKSAVFVFFFIFVLVFYFVFFLSGLSFVTTLSSQVLGEGAPLPLSPFGRADTIISWPAVNCWPNCLCVCVFGWLETKEIKTEINASWLFIDLLSPADNGAQQQQQRRQHRRRLQLNELLCDLSKGLVAWGRQRMLASACSQIRPPNETHLLMCPKSQSTWLSAAKPDENN